VSAWPGILAGAPAVAFAEAYEVGPFASLFLVAGPLPDYQSTPDQGSSIHSRHTNSSLRRSLYGHAAFGPRRFGFGLHWPNHLNEEDLSVPIQLPWITSLPTSDFRTLYRGHCAGV